MVFEICAIIVTIIICAIGVYLIHTLKHIRQLAEETTQAMKAVNQDLPVILNEVKISVSEFKESVQTVQEGVLQVATGVDRLAPTLTVAGNIVGTLRTGINVWHRIRKKGA